MIDLNKEFNLYATKGKGINSLTLDRYKKYYGMSGIVTQTRDSYINPTIIEERALNVAQMDVFSRLMMDRIIFLGTAIDDDVANIIQAQLLFLESVNQTADIQIYLNSPGGYVQAGLGIYDVMQYITPDVATICTGLAASMASVLLCAGAPKKRTALKHSRVMIHQPMGGAQGQASDMAIAVEEILKTKQELYSIISQHSGQPIEKIEQDADRDHWLTSAEALEYGMIDEILERQKETTLDK
ncbi:MAG: ATP-dependent Clp protease proteolytic subunit [Bacteroidales bacterium]|nr:ATP-dependent Clp protease proteolytic subunit [Bacteroidales bacterium]